MSRAGLWPVARDQAAINTNAVIPRGRFCFPNPHRVPSGSGEFSKLPGMLETATGRWQRACGTGTVAAPAWGGSSSGLPRGPVRPQAAGPRHLLRSPQGLYVGHRRVGTCLGPPQPVPSRAGSGPTETAVLAECSLGLGQVCGLVLSLAGGLSGGLSVSFEKPVI